MGGGNFGSVDKYHGNFEILKQRGKLVNIKDLLILMELKTKRKILNMMLNYKGLIKLSKIAPDREFWIRTIFREYKVQRLDAKNENDDYYDLMLTDISSLIKNSIALINITLNSDNRGRIVALIPIIDSKYFIQAKSLQDYFSSESCIYLVEDIKLLYPNRD